MARTFLDSDFREWEVFVNTARGGFAHPQRLVFRCLSDRALPSRVHALPDGADQGAAVLGEADPATLRDLLGEAEPLS